MPNTLQRNERLLEIIDELSVSGLVLYDADYIKYYTGFAFIPTERPMAYVMSRGGRTRPVRPAPGAGARPIDVDHRPRRPLP